MNFNIMDSSGLNIKCDILGMFEQNNKKYVIYTDCEDGNIEKEVYASLYELDEKGNMVLTPILNDSDWDIVDNFLGEI